MFDHCLVHRHDASLRPHGVVQLGRLERVTQLGVPVGVACTIEGQDRNVVHSEVIGVRVSRLVIAVGDDHLGTGPADDGNQTANRFVQIGLMEAIRMIVGLGFSHPRVAVAEHLDLIETNNSRRRRQLGLAHCSDQLTFLLRLQPVERLARFAQRWVLQVAFFATRTANEHGMYPRGSIQRKGRRTL